MPDTSGALAVLESLSGCTVATESQPAVTGVQAEAMQAAIVWLVEQAKASGAELAAAKAEIADANATIEALTAEGRRQSRAMTSRLNEVAQNVDVRLLEGEESLARRMDGAVSALDERVNVAEERLARAEGNLDSMRAARVAPGARACAVEQESSAAAAIAQGGARLSSVDRIAHVEWLLDALQMDFEAMHAHLGKMKAEQTQARASRHRREHRARS